MNTWETAGGVASVVLGLVVMAAVFGGLLFVLAGGLHLLVTGAVVLLAQTGVVLL